MIKGSVDTAMSLRPTRAHWFETYVPREQTVYALDALAGSASVELEADPRFSVPLDLQPVRDRLRRFDMLLRPYADYLPDVECRSSAIAGSPELVVAKATKAMERWLLESEREHGRLRDIEFELRALDLLEECVQALGEDGQSLPAFGHSSQFLYKGLYACPRELRPEETFHAVFEAVHTGPEHRFVVVVAPPDGEIALSEQAVAAGCRRVRVPDWLSGDTSQQLDHVRTRREELERELVASRASIAELNHDPRVTEALANVSLIRWFTEHAHTLGKAHSLCHITGWTSESDSGPLQERLNRAGIQVPVRFAEPPVSVTGPVGMRHSGWLRPFQAIVELWGTPGQSEIDPTGLLAFVIPLLFGYMFPDVGHGAILIVLSLALYRRWPQGRILIPCGISAMIFGVVFGEVLGFEDVIEPLWVRPLDAPLQILVAPLFLGIALVLVGIVFSGIEARWRGELREWMLTDAAVLLLYASSLVAIAYPPALLASAIAVLWYLAGSVLKSTRSGRGLRPGPCRAIRRGAGDRARHREPARLLHRSGHRAWVGGGHRDVGRLRADHAFSAVRVLPAFPACRGPHPAPYARNAGGLVPTSARSAAPCNSAFHRRPVPGVSARRERGICGLWVRRFRPFSLRDTPGICDSIDL
jgi:V/A-type H+-transporting ATPase subunit I